MFGIGLFEALVIALVVIVFVNPRDLPAFLRQVGRLAARLQAARDELVRQVDELGREAEPPPAGPSVYPEVEEEQSRKGEPPT